MLESILNFFNQSKVEVDNKKDDDLMIVGGILVEAASIDGEIANIEVTKIKDSLNKFFDTSEEKSEHIVNSCLKKVGEPNSFYYYTSKINQEFNNDAKIKLLEILWSIILSDGKIHDFESNLIRRISGLLYISDVDCGNAKKRAIENNIENNK